LSQDRSAPIIAGRSSTIRGTDPIVVPNGSTLGVSDSHAEPMAKRGFCAAMPKGV